MRMRFISLLFGFFTAVSTVFAQQGAAASAGDAPQLSYTIGLPFYTQPESISGSAYQGNQQPYEISFITRVLEQASSTHDIIAYPNPVMHTLTVSANDASPAPLRYTVHSADGRLVVEDQVMQWPMNIDASQWATGSYVLSLYSDSPQRKVILIQKQQ